MNIAIFFTNKPYTNDDCESITLQEHLMHLESDGCASPDCWDSYDKLSVACDEARKNAAMGNDCIIVDLDADATYVLETFNASDYEDYLK